MLVPCENSVVCLVCVTSICRRGPMPCYSVNWVPGQDLPIQHSHSLSAVEHPYSSPLSLMRDLQGWDRKRRSDWKLIDLLSGTPRRKRPLGADFGKRAAVLKMFPHLTGIGAVKDGRTGYRDSEFAGPFFFPIPSAVGGVATRRQGLNGKEKVHRARCLACVYTVHLPPDPCLALPCLTQSASPWSTRNGPSRAFPCPSPETRIVQLSGRGPPLRNLRAVSAPGPQAPPALPRCLRITPCGFEGRLNTTVATQFSSLC